MPGLKEDRALSIVAEFSRVALMLSKSEHGMDAAISNAIERANTLGFTIRFYPDFVSIGVEGDKVLQAAVRRADNTYCAALEACFRLIVSRVRTLIRVRSERS